MSVVNAYGTCRSRHRAPVYPWSRGLPVPWAWQSSGAGRLPCLLSRRFERPGLSARAAEGWPYSQDLICEHTASVEMP